MPHKAPKGGGDDRSGRGINLGGGWVGNDANHWRARRNPQPGTPSAGAGPSFNADSNASQRMSVGYPESETYGPDDVGTDIEVDEHGECGCINPGQCACSNRGDMIGESLLRAVLREILTEDLAGSQGPWGRAPTDLESAAHRRPDLGDRPYLDEIDLVDEDEDEDEEYPHTNEFSAVGGGVGGGAAIQGYSLPLGKKSTTPTNKRRSGSRTVKGHKTTHG